RIAVLLNVELHGGVDLPPGSLERAGHWQNEADLHRLLRRGDRRKRERQRAGDHAEESDHAEPPPFVAAFIALRRAGINPPCGKSPRCSGCERACSATAAASAALMMPAMTKV